MKNRAIAAALILALLISAIPANALGQEHAYYRYGVLSGSKQYDWQEPVRFTFKNTAPPGTDIMIKLPHTNPWKVYTSTGDLLVYSAWDQETVKLTNVSPQQAITWSWDQKDAYGKQVSPGWYTIRLFTNVGSYTHSFKILSQRETEAKEKAKEKVPSKVINERKKWQMMQEMLVVMFLWQQEQLVL